MATWHSTDEFWKGPNQFPDNAKIKALAKQGIIQVEIVDAIKCRVIKAQWPPIARLLTYQEMVYIKKRNKVNRTTYSGEKKIVQKQLVLSRQHGYVYFLSGHLPRIKAHFPNIIIKYNKNTINVLNIPEYKPLSKKVSLIGISPREDQLEAVQEVENHNRGIIVAPTGTGKTVIISTIVQKYNKLNILVCAHTIDLVTQMKEAIEKFTGKKCQVLHGTIKPDWDKLEQEDGNILVTTIQSFKKQIMIDYSYLFDVVLIDESHHANSLECNYGKMLQIMPAPIRVGFTATLPTEQKAKLCLEGLLGPVIYNLTLDHAKEKNLIVQPKIKLHKIPYSQKINNIRKYHQVIEEAIMKNFILNSKIVELVQENKITAGNMLIFIQFIEQGEYIQALCARNDIHDVEFMQGETIKEEREKVKKHMEETKGNVVICTTIWREGINIPSLDSIVLGGGWKSPTPILQAIGRGLRTFEDKKEVIIHDFFDPSHNYLISHFGERLSLYFEMEWM